MSEKKVDEPNENKSRTERPERLAHTKGALRELYGFAIKAEKKSGINEDTRHKANRSLLLRTVTIFFGSVITFLGILMLTLPGPGLLVTALGLGILSKDIPFARRWLKIVRDRLPQDEKGALTKGTIITMIVVATIGVALSATSLWFTFWR